MKYEDIQELMEYENFSLVEIKEYTEHVFNLGYEQRKKDEDCGVIAAEFEKKEEALRRYLKSSFECEKAEFIEDYSDKFIRNVFSPLFLNQMLLVISGMQMEEDLKDAIDYWRSQSVVDIEEMIINAYKESKK